MASAPGRPRRPRGRPVPWLVVAVFPLDDPPGPQEAAVAALLTVPPVADELGRLFADAGFSLHLVGGSVRDLLLGRADATADLDFTTDARPDDVLRVTKRWAQGIWDAGIRFGTVGVIRNGQRLEITTYRSEQYDADSRNPDVSFGDTLAGDLVRRDFTINAMAVSVPGHVFVDPGTGLADLARGVLRTPAAPRDSFTDDPLRMLRAARFVSQLPGFALDPDVRAVMPELAERLRIVAPERVRDELSKLLLGADPVAGLEVMVDAGLAAQVLPELPALRLERDEHARHKDVYAHTLQVLRQAIERETAGPDLVLRLAALLHDIGKPATRRIDPRSRRVSFHHHDETGARLARKRLTALRFPKALIDEVVGLVALHLRFYGYVDTMAAGPEPVADPAANGRRRDAWSDSAVRRYVHDAGPLLDRLHLLVRSDCTTRNQRKAARLAAAYDDLERRIARLGEQEELARMRPDLDGNDIQGVLQVGPGRLVGEARQFLLDLRIDEGPLGDTAALHRLVAWARERGVEVPDGAEERLAAIRGAAADDG
jgi:poly(A) polymerase